MRGSAEVLGESRSRGRSGGDVALIRYWLFDEVFELEASEQMFRSVIDYCGFIEGVEWGMINVVKGGEKKNGTTIFAYQH